MFDFQIWGPFSSSTQSSRWNSIVIELCISIFCKYPLFLLLDSDRTLEKAQYFSKPTPLRKTCCQILRHNILERLETPRNFCSRRSLLPELQRHHLALDGYFYYISKIRFGEITNVELVIRARWTKRTRTTRNTIQIRHFAILNKDIRFGAISEPLLCLLVAGLKVLDELLVPWLRRLIHRPWRLNTLFSFWVAEVRRHKRVSSIKESELIEERHTLC